MGYAGQVQGPKTYYPSDAVIAEDATTTMVTTAAYAKFKSLILVAHIGSSSKFRFYFEMIEPAGPGNSVYGQIYRNGIAVGTEQVLSLAVWTGYTEDINTTNWTIGDTVELWCKYVNFNFPYCRNFRLEGVGSEWEVV
jgi:hypothetical protein